MHARDPVNDCRKLKPEQQEELRRRVVSAIQDGMAPADAERAFKIAYGSIFNWLARYRHGGWDALKTGARSGRPHKLDARMMRWVYETVTNKNPLQLKFHFALWSREMVRSLIRSECGMTLGLSSVSRLLHQLGLSVQRPLWRAWQQNPELVRKWKEEELPKLRREAKRLNAKIYFEDESGVRRDFHPGTTWGKRGVPPIVRVTGTRFSLNMLSAISPKGELRFMVTDQRVTAAIFCAFLDRLMHGETGHVFLVVDGHPTHKAKLVKRHVGTYGGRLRLYFLPPYSPELNPDEYVWGWVKSQRVGRQIYSDKTQLRGMLISALRSLQRRCDTLRGFFRATDLAYITV